MKIERILLWSGYHSEHLHSFVQFCWEQDYLLICCPPKLKDFSFMNALPEGEISFCGQWESGIPTMATTNARANHYPARPVLGVFTTGTTTSERKLVLYTKENILSCQEAIFSLYDHRKIKRVFCYPQPYHVFGLLLGYVAAFSRGWSLYNGKGPYGEAYHDAWFENVDDTTITLATPAHLKDLTHYVKTKKLIPRPSYSCIIGGARVDVNDWTNARSILLIKYPSIGYGCTEASPGITHLPPGAKPISDGDIGFLLNRTKIVLHDDGFEAFSPSVAFATIEGGMLSFPKKITIRDRLEQQDDGRFTFKERTDHTLNRGGEKFSLEQIETLLKQKFHLDTICVPISDERLGEELAILAQRNTKKRLTLKRSDVFKELGSEFGRRFNEDHFMEVERLPTNDNQKPDRKRAQEILKKEFGTDEP